MKPTENEQPEVKEPVEATEPVESPPEIDVKDIPDNILQTVENTESKRNLIFKIQKYQDSSRFGKIVKYELGFKETFVELSDKSENDLENMLHRIRTHLDNKNLDKFYENMATTLAITYETTLSPFYNIDGFSDMLLENEDFWNSYERLRIETEFPSINPTTQMLFMIAQLTIIAHHTRDIEYEDDKPHIMEAPPELETIIEGIEEGSDVVITDPDDNSSNNVTEAPPPISLGQTL